MPMAELAGAADAGAPKTAIVVSLMLANWPRYVKGEVLIRDGSARFTREESVTLAAATAVDVARPVSFGVF